MDSHFTVLQDKKLGAGSGTAVTQQSSHQNVQAKETFLTTPLTLNITVSTKHLLHVTTKYFNVH